MIKCLVCRERTAPNEMDKGFTCRKCTDALTLQDMQLRNNESYDSYRARVFGILAVA